jgi:hypothetical protein
MDTATATPDTNRSAPTSTRRIVGRWLVTLLGFPAGGLAASLTVGPVDSVAAAVAGGLVTGLVLGAVQAWGLRLTRQDGVRWSLATAAGLALGLVAGAGAVRFGTGLEALAVQGAVTGLGVGAAQALLLRPRLGRAVAGWPAALALVWAAGWTVTTLVGVEVDERFTVFGSSGALLVTVATVVLPLALRRSAARA